MLAVDILHDVGRSLNPAIDLGQIEARVRPGMGWLTMEELVYDARGRLLTHAPSTYKIPTANDRPARNGHPPVGARPQRRGDDPRSKAVGEPPFMLAISVFSALTQAVAAAAPGKGLPSLDAPATPERILSAVARTARASWLTGPRRRAPRWPTARPRSSPSSPPRARHLAGRGRGWS